MQPHLGWGDATSESKIWNVQSPPTWSSGPQWGVGPAPSALFGDMYKDLGYTVLHCPVDLLWKAFSTQKSQSHKAMVVSGAEILKYVSAWGVLEESTGNWKPFHHKTICSQFDIYFEGKFPGIPMENPCPRITLRESLFLYRLQRVASSHWWGSRWTFSWGWKLLSSSRKHSCWQLKILCLGLQIKWRNVCFHGTPRNRWLLNSGKAHSPAPQQISCSLWTCVFQAWMSAVSVVPETNSGSSEERNGGKNDLKTMWDVSSRAEHHNRP